MWMGELFSKKEKSKPNVLSAEFYRSFKEPWPILLKLQKRKKRKEEERKNNNKNKNNKNKNKKKQNKKKGDREKETLITSIQLVSL